MAIAADKELKNCNCKLYIGKLAIWNGLCCGHEVYGRTSQWTISVLSLNRRDLPISPPTSYIRLNQAKSRHLLTSDYIRPMIVTIARILNIFDYAFLLCVPLCHATTIAQPNQLPSIRILYSTNSTVCVRIYLSSSTECLNEIETFVSEKLTLADTWIDDSWCW